jgi:rod shape-determining protein MreD
MTGVALRSAIVILTAMVLQASVLAQLRLFGVSIDLLLVVAVAAGLMGGPDRGAIMGFFAGLAMDLLVQTPFGLSAFTYLIIGYVCGMTLRFNLRVLWWFPLVVAALAGSMSVILFALLGEIVGQPLMSLPNLTEIVLVVGVTSAMLVVPATWAVRWAARPEQMEGPAVI